MDPDVKALLKRVPPAELGERLKNARLAADLTQGELAGSDASVAYVSRIESGQRRPNYELLSIFAERLGTTVEELVLGISADVRAADQLQLDYAELALKSSEPRRAVDLTADLLTRAAQSHEPGFVERVRLVHAAGLEAVGDLSQALDVLEEVLAVERGGTMSRAAAAIALSRCYREVGDLGRAISVAESSLTRLGDAGLAGTDEELQLVATLAAAYFERGDVSYATRLCHKAIQAAEASGSASARAAIYWNASIMQSEGGDPVGALPLARRALALLEEVDQLGNLSRLRAQLAVMQLQLDPPEIEEATAALEQAAAEFGGLGGSAVDQARTTFHLARAKYLALDYDAARTLAERASADSIGMAPTVAADSLALLGQLDAVAGDLDGARRYYQRAALELAAAGEVMDRQTAQLWLDLASLLESVGLSAEALDAYRRSAASSGLRPSATRSASRARI